ncbi:MAG: serine/threonine protein kinase [Spirochaetes bacterium]|nr:serine/threonine protein kinase [Spirochaetota bacterium]
MPKPLIKVGKYDIVKKIAKGGMGAVYLAKHPTLKRFVILKQLTLRGGGGFVQRFKREASLMIDFRDEHIVPVYDHFKVGSSYYIAMEYVDGTSLDRLIEESGGLSNEAALLIFSEICRGLKYAHDKDVIHRDIKPANVLISKQGEVKLTDFGIATSKEAEEEGLTKIGMTLGTPAYMSPEQIADTSKVDMRADIYSMGVMFYEMLTGKKPFPSRFSPDVIDKISKGIYVNPKKINPTIPRAFLRIIKRTMNCKVNKRYKDLGSVLNILDRYTKKYKGQREINADVRRYLEGNEITLPTTMKVGKKRHKRGGILIGVTVGLAALTVLFLGGLFCYYKGYVYEYLRAREYGKLEITASIPQDYFKEARLIYAYALLTCLDETDAEAEGSGPEYHYRLTPKREGFLYPILKEQASEEEDAATGPDEALLSTGDLYLRAGNYELVLYLENGKHIMRFYLYPRVLQRENLDTEDKRNLAFRVPISVKKQITIDHRVSDSETGMSLYDEADIDFYLAEQDRWLDWKFYHSNRRLAEYLASKLQSGERYRFRYSADGYYDVETEFYVETSLDSAVSEVGLIRKSGTLVVESDYEGLDILIDNRAESYIGVQKKQFVRYEDTTLEPKKFPLSEGTYAITVGRGKRTVQNAQFRIVGEKTTRVRVTYDPGEKSIGLEVERPGG